MEKEHRAWYEERGGKSVELPMLSISILFFLKSPRVHQL